MLETAVRKAQQAGEIDPTDDPRQIAYELNALTTAANRSAQLLGDPMGWKHARRAIHRLLASIRIDRPGDSTE